MDSRRTLAIGGLLLALGTVFGAMGAHALKTHLTAERLQVFETAVHYHLFNALGLVGIGLALRSLDGWQLRMSAQLVLVGVLLFSGSLYALTFGAPRLVGLLTPMGGLALIAGWLLFSITFLRLQD